MLKFSGNDREAAWALVLSSIIFIFLYYIAKLLHENGISRITCGFNPNVNKECLCNGDTHTDYEGILPDDGYSPFLYPVKALCFEGLGFFFWSVIVVVRHTCRGEAAGDIKDGIFEGSTVRTFALVCVTWSLGFGIPEVLMGNPIAGIFAMPFMYIILRRKMYHWVSSYSVVNDDVAAALISVKRFLKRIALVFVFVGVAPVMLVAPLVNNFGVDVFTVLAPLITSGLEKFLNDFIFSDKAVRGIGEAPLTIVARNGLAFVESYRLATLSVSAATSETLWPVVASIGLGVMVSVSTRESLLGIAISMLRCQPREQWKPTPGRFERLLLGAKLDTEYIPFVVCAAVATMHYVNDTARDCAGDVVPGLRPPFSALVIILGGEIISGLAAHYFGAWFSTVAPDVAVSIKVAHPSSRYSVLILQYLACFGVSTLAYCTMGGAAYDVAYKNVMAVR